MYSGDIHGRLEENIVVEWKGWARGNQEVVKTILS